MKYRYIILLMILSIGITFGKKKEVEEFVMPENIEVSEDRNTIVGVYESDLTQSEIYSKSLEWLADLITDSKSAIEHKDEKFYKIIGHSSIAIIEMGFSRNVKFKFKIEIKEGRYRITLTDLHINYPQAPAKHQYLYFDEEAQKKNRMKKHVRKIWNEEIAPKIFLVLESLNAFMNTKTDDDW